MKQVKKAAMFWGLLALLAAAPPAALAQQPPARPAQPAPRAPAQSPVELPPTNSVVVVVDVNLIMRDSAAALVVRNQIERQRTTYQAEIAKQENELRNADQELSRQRTILSAEAFAQKRRELEKRVTDAQQIVQNRRRALDQAFGTSMQQVEQAMIDVIAEILAERNYLVVLPKSQVVMVQTAFEITAEVLTRINRKLPTVAVTIPQN
ncbi:MAG: OmpH family outer membrane protein [Pseudomonadota bacterium]